MFPLFNAQEMAQFVHGKGEYRGLSIAQVLKQWEQVIPISFFQKRTLAFLTNIKQKFNLLPIH